MGVDLTRCRWRKCKCAVGRGHVSANVVYLKNTLFDDALIAHVRLSLLSCINTTYSYIVRPCRLSLIYIFRHVLWPRYMEVGRGPKTNLMSYPKKGGTGKNEAFHSSINRSVDGTSHISAEAIDMKLLARVHRHNYEMDRKHRRTSKESTGRVWIERDANDAAKLCLTTESFPKAGPRPQVRPESSPFSSRCAEVLYLVYGKHR